MKLKYLVKVESFIDYTTYGIFFIIGFVPVTFCYFLGELDDLVERRLEKFKNKLFKASKEYKNGDFNIYSDEWIDILTPKSAYDTVYYNSLP